MHEDITGFFTPLAHATRSPPKWVIKDVLPVGLTFVGAPPKSKKSTFIMALSALTAGYDCKALPPNMSVVESGGPVMGLSAEATAGELRDMCETGMDISLRDDDGILIADDPWKFRLDDDGGLGQLLHWLDVVDPRLCFIDPLRDFHQLEEKDSGGMNRLLRPIRQWAVEHESAVIVAHHTKKKDEPGTYSAMDMRGTTALFGIADAVLMLTPINNGALNIQATFKRATGWEKKVVIAAYDMKGKAGHAMLDAMSLRVMYEYAKGTATSDAVAKSLQTAKVNVLRALKELVENGYMKMEGKRYVLTDEGNAYTKQVRGAERLFNSEESENVEG